MESQQLKTEITLGTYSENSVQSNDLWLCPDDFYEILWSFEKSGDFPRPKWQMKNFRNTVDECGLVDLGFIGKWFTWERGSNVDSRVHVRLDRGMANERWCEFFSQFYVQHLNASVSDHCPIMVCDDPRKDVKRPRRKTRYFFEAMWTKDGECREIVNKCWLENGSGSLGEKMKATGSCLKQ
ncbi:hypothetical protein PTKIN_Ptkin12aG0063000 [Pterospermum kingtungense]